MSGYLDAGTFKLGFGLMRLPKNADGTIDVPQTAQMADKFIAAGGTYFDTAFVYDQGASEAAFKAAVADRYPRSAYTVATKLNAFMAPEKNEQSAKQEFYTSLERTGAGYFDYYLLHALQRNNIHLYDDYHLWDFVNEQKEKGLIRNIGFSFHGTPALLDQLLTVHPEVDFIQLQINYADWENPKVTSRANYEIARKHGKLITVMEPVKGGNLASPPNEVQQLFKGIHPDMSFASWAIRYVASLDGILTVLSGMSNVSQMQDNLSYMKDFEPLTEEEQEAIRQAQRIIGNYSTIPCTACQYCVEGCPKQIRIPDIFAAMNKQLGNGQMAEAKEAYDSAAPEGHRASDCIACRQCEGACPQHLPIPDYLVKAKEMFESL